MLSVSLNKVLSMIPQVVHFSVFVSLCVCVLCVIESVICVVFSVSMYVCVCVCFVYH